MELDLHMKILSEAFNKLENKYFSNFNDFKKHFLNVFWMFSGKTYFILASGLMSILVARYLKPENFGVINYSLSLIAIFSPLVTLGIEQILIKDLIDEKDIENKLMGSSFLLKLFGSFLAIILLNVLSFVTNQDEITKIIIFILSFTLLFKSLDIINFYLQAFVKIKYFVIIESIVFTISLILKIVFIFYEKNIYYFAFTYLIEAVLIAIGLIFVYKSILKKKFSNWHFDYKKAKDILNKSYPLIISSLMITIYMKIDQIIINNLIGSRETGLYAVAVKLSEMWYFIPVSLVTATFPSLIGTFRTNKDKFNKRFKQLTSSLIIISVAIAILTTIFGEKIIYLLYGGEYLDSVSVFKIYIWAAIPVSLGLTSSKWLVINNLQKYNIHSTVIGSITNIALNFLLIPRFGIVGSAWATLISYSLSGFIIYLFMKETRELFKLLLTSIFKLPLNRIWLK